MARYTNIPVIKSLNDKQMYQTVRYPEIPRSEDDIYVITTIGDRYDTLALEYYQDSIKLNNLQKKANLQLFHQKPLSYLVRFIIYLPINLIRIYKNTNNQYFMMKLTI